MANFSKLKKLELTAAATAVYVFTNIDGAPQVTVKPSTEINKPYYNALLKRIRKNQRANPTVNIIAENREEDRQLFVQHIIVGWDNMKEITDDTTFNKENCKDFLDALPDYEFDGLREFCSNPANFVESIDKELAAKN